MYMQVCVCVFVCVYINENEQQKYKYVNDENVGSYPPYSIPSCLLFEIGGEKVVEPGAAKAESVVRSVGGIRNQKKNRSIMELLRSSCMKRGQPSSFPKSSEISTYYIHTNRKHIDTGIRWLQHRYYVRKPQHKHMHAHEFASNTTKFRRPNAKYGWTLSISFLVGIFACEREGERVLAREKNTRLSLSYISSSFL